MSFGAMVWAYSWSGELSPAEKFVLVTIAYHFNRDRLVAFPSTASIAKSTELSERHVKRCLHVLADRGLIEIAPRLTRTGRRTSNSYYLPLYDIRSTACDVTEGVT
jgi:hypothetical protein